MTGVQGGGTTGNLGPLTDDPWIRQHELTAVIAPTLPAFPGRELIAGNERTVRVVNIVHPCRVKSFRKAVSAVMDDLVKVLANKSIRTTYI